MNTILFQNIGLASDHAGFSMKSLVKKKLSIYPVVLFDYGCLDEKSVDYPDYAHALSSALVEKKIDVGILFCGSGNGIAMAANKHAGVRAALCWKEEIAVLARQHNNANILSLPARFLSEPEILQIVMIFLSTSFEGGRHETRVKKIDF